MNLYEITSEMLILQEAFENEEATDELLEAYDKIDMTLEHKTESYCKVIRNSKAKSEGLAMEIKRLQALKKQQDALQRNLKQRLHNALEVLGKSLVETPLFKVNFRKSKSLSIIDESLIPDEFKKTEITISKSSIKEAINDGADVPGAEIVTNQNIQIK